MADPVQTVCLCEKALLVTVITAKVEREWGLCGESRGWGGALGRNGVQGSLAMRYWYLLVTSLLR